MMKNFTKAGPCGPFPKQQTQIHELTHQNHILGVRGNSLLGLNSQCLGLQLIQNFQPLGCILTGDRLQLIC